MKLTSLLRPRTPQPTNDLVVVVGLRNPGSKYEETRHNIGFEVVAHLALRSRIEFGRAPSRVNAEVAQIRQPRALLVAPFTFMNDSGRAVRGALDYWKVTPERLLVIHDDIDLDFGRLRLQVGGGTGGHNGLRSIESHLGTREFSRLKVGVGRPPGSMAAADFVLRRFAKSEQPGVVAMVSDAADVVETWFDNPSRAQEQAAHRRD